MPSLHPYNFCRKFLLFLVLAVALERLSISNRTCMYDCMYHTLLACLSDNARDVLQVLSSSSRPLDKKTRAMLKVEFLAPVQTVRIEGIKDDKCDESLLEMYFQNKKKSGAGVNTNVEVTGRGQATISFEPKDLSGEYDEYNFMNVCMHA